MTASLVQLVLVQQAGQIRWAQMKMLSRLHLTGLSCLM